MSIHRKLPQISLLLRKVEEKMPRRPHTHDDFVVLREMIFNATKQMVSDSTLERVWGYSTRGDDYENVSLRTLDVLSEFACGTDWMSFCEFVAREMPSESDRFDTECVDVAHLEVGDCLTIGWQPNRVCRVRYLGDNRFIAEEAINSKLKKGDTFSCLQFQLGSPLFMENVAGADGKMYAPRYGVGLRHGLSMLRFQHPHTK